jgi:hypothetical protein
MRPKPNCFGIETNLRVGVAREEAVQPAARTARRRRLQTKNERQRFNERSSTGLVN